jgi:hypothetical protein
MNNESAGGLTSQRDFGAHLIDRAESYGTRTADISPGSGIVCPNPYPSASARFACFPQDAAPFA